MAALNQNHTYSKARFFKCALQVNSASCITYRGQQQLLSEDDYSAALEAGIAVIGLADHGSVESVDPIRDLFTQNENEIMVFPSFEMASSEKIHFVCLFDESTASDHIKPHLGALTVDINKLEAPVQKCASDIINYVNDNKSFIFAAHSTNDNGL